MHSGSSRDSGSALSTTVTSAPSRRKAWASARPVRPAPSTMRCEGQTVSSEIVSGVRNGVASRPEIGGRIGAEPVATTNRRALISSSLPVVTEAGLTKRPVPSTTRTPSAAIRAFNSLRAALASTSRRYARTRAKSTVGWAWIPKAAPSVAIRAQPAAVINALASNARRLPPICPFSTRTTGTPKAAAEVATASPPAPPPITHKSALMSSAIPSLQTIDPGAKARCAPTLRPM